MLQTNPRVLAYQVCTYIPLSGQELKNLFAFCQLYVDIHKLHPAKHSAIFPTPAVACFGHSFPAPARTCGKSGFLLDTELCRQQCPLAQEVWLLQQGRVLFRRAAVT